MSNMPPSKRNPREDLTPTDDRTKVGNLDYKVAGMISYLPVCLVNVIMSVVFLRTEPNSNQVLRFHATQSLVLTVACVALMIALNITIGLFGMIPVLNMIVVPLAAIGIGLASAAYILINVIMMVKAFQGEEYRLPILGAFAEKYMPTQSES